MMEEGGQGEEEGPAGGREGERVQVAATRGSRGREGRTGSGGVKGRRDGGRRDGGLAANSSHTFLRAQTSHQEELCTIFK